MKILLEFDRTTSDFIREGYYKKHKKHLDDSLNTLKYSELPEYIKLGKQVKRRHAWGSFLENWGAIIFWVIAIAMWFGWQEYQSQQHKNNDDTSSYSHSSKSGIYYSENCPITTCNDGACSTSTGRGTCSHHGGVRD